MVRVDTNVILLQTEGKAARVNGLQFMMVLQVRPTPQTTVDDMWEAFTMRDLEREREWEGGEW